MTELYQLAPEPIEIVTASKRFRMDCETPVSLYLKAAMEKPYGFILESVDHGEHSGRFSFIGWDPILRLFYEPSRLVFTGAISGELQTEKPIDSLKNVLNCIKMLDEQTIPNAKGGLVGHISYDAIRLVEDIGPMKPTHSPWLDFMMPRCLLILDHLNHIVTVLCHQVVKGDEGHARDLAGHRLSEVLDKIRTFSVTSAATEIHDQPASMDGWESNLSQEAFCEMVNKAKQHIVDGDIFQVVLSRAVRRKFLGNPFEIYRVLRMVNPSPYMYYLKQDERVIVGGSPEALVTLDHGVLTTKPIAGTRPRGKDLQEDLALEQDLLTDEKEVAEHVMLVDLGRNDLGRVSRPASVTVPRFLQIERYSHVMHIVSVVQSDLDEGLHALDAMMSVFPAGTLSGAPKIRAMQIINDFEPEARDVYGGAIGFLDFSGNMDSCIAIRTATVEDGIVRVQAGAGIVADSVPQSEFDETTHKMMSMVTAVEKAMGISNRRGSEEGGRS